MSLSHNTQIRPLFSNDIPAERRLGSIQVLVCGQLGGQDDAIPQMDAAVKVMNSAEKTSRIPIAKTIFSSVSLLLVTIRVSSLPFCDNWPRVYTAIALYNKEYDI